MTAAGDRAGVMGPAVRAFFSFTKASRQEYRQSHGHSL